MKKYLITVAFTLIFATIFAQTEKKALLASTNFNIPMVQFTPISDNTTKKGDVSFFNAVGAGVSLSYADITIIQNEKKDNLLYESKNKFGLQTGFLFSASNTANNTTNRFAWTMSLIILDFQFGFGHEFGTIGEMQKRNFFMLSYNIPLSKLTKGGTYVFRRNKPKGGRLQSYNKAGFFF